MLFGHNLPAIPNPAGYLYRNAAKFKSGREVISVSIKQTGNSE
jgi:hypothetical protein